MTVHVGRCPVCENPMLLPPHCAVCYTREEMAKLPPALAMEAAMPVVREQGSPGRKR
jgi:hypothetical protein